MTIRPRPFFAIPRLSSPESQLTSTSIFVGESDVSLCNLVRNLGLLIDSSTTLHHNVSAVVWTCYFHLRTLGKLRPFLTKRASTSVAVSTLLSRLDYCDSCLWGLPGRKLCLLQLLQNIAPKTHWQKRENAWNLSWNTSRSFMCWPEGSFTGLRLFQWYSSRISSRADFSLKPPRSLRSSSQSYLHVHV